MGDNELGKYLRELRGDRSLRYISELSNGEISHSFLSDIEKGHSRRGNEVRPSLDKLAILARVYNVNFNELMKLAGYNIDAPENAEASDIIELEKVLDDNVNMSYGGENLTEEEKQRVKDIITGLFWEKAQKRKEGGVNDRTN